MRYSVNFVAGEKFAVFELSKSQLNSVFGMPVRKFVEARFTKEFESTKKDAKERLFANFLMIDKLKSEINEIDPKIMSRLELLFSTSFADCLNVTFIVEQPKFAFDREIGFRAHRLEQFIALSLIQNYFLVSKLEFKTIDENNEQLEITVEKAKDIWQRTEQWTVNTWTGTFNREDLATTEQLVSQVSQKMFGPEKYSFLKKTNNHTAQ